MKRYLLLGSYYVSSYCSSLRQKLPEMLKLKIRALAFGFSVDKCPTP